MRRRTLVLAAAATLLLPISPVSAQNQGYVPIEARIWLDHGVEPILHSGDRVQVFYRTNYDAYVSIFHINTDGRVTLLHPSSPGSPHYVRGGRDYRLRISNRDYWRVQDDAGVGYFFVLASPTPFDFGAFPSAGYGGWNLMSVGSEVYRDPFVAMDDYVSYLIPDWTQAEYALDFSLYNIERRYDYPRFLCYDSHRYQTFSSWNPYLNACRSFRVVIYTDPYYYPAYRYRADRVVYARPIAIRQPQFSFKELARGESAVPLRTARPNAVAVAGPPSSAARSGASRPGSVSGQGGVGVVGGAAVRPIRPNPSTRNRGANATATVRGRPTDAVSGRIRLGATATTRPPTSTGSVRPPTSTGSAVRPGGGGSAAVRRPTSGGSAVRPGGGSSARPPASTGSAVRPGGGGSAARPRPTTGSARPPATTGSARPPASTGSAVKPGGRSTGSARPPVRPGRGGGAGGRGGG